VEPDKADTPGWVGDGDELANKPPAGRPANVATEGFVSEGVIAELLNVSTGHLANLRWRGDGPRYYDLGRPGRGRCVRYRIADVLAWAEARATTSTTESRERARHRERLP
jgi:hypothetical protein